VAKLAIYRGETLDREIELAPRAARIGRSDQNDIVLPDPAKSVSRFHAELRFENGKFVLADLNSQNGTWVAGKRVQQVTLEAGNPVVLGTYRLVFIPDELPADGEKTMIVQAAAPPPPAEPKAVPVPPAPAAVTAPPPVPPAKAEEPRPTPPAPKPEPPKVDAPKPEPPKPELPKPAPAPPPPVVPKPVTPPKPVVPPPAPKPAAPPAPAAAPAPPPAAKSPAAAKPAAKGGKKLLLMAAGLILVLGAVAAGLFLWPSGGKKPQAPPADQAQAAPAAMPGGPPTEAPAAVPPAAQQPEPAAPPAAAPAAPAESAAPPAAAKTVRPRTPGDAPPPPPRERKDAAAKAKTAPEPKAKPLNLPQTLEQARSAMIRGDYLAAIGGFESILKVDPRYPDAAELLGVARNGAKNAAQLSIDAGNKAEMSGDYDGAARQYERAQQLDPDSSAPADAMRRLKARMQGEGEDAFKRGKQFDALGRSSDAIGMYEKAIKLLPAEHASSKAAKERLAALKGGN
jgi:pSer/pThr/pTyr-binding forkhead associated (FHA) protein/tetratricopeptide (TPR) repeat protein